MPVEALSENCHKLIASLETLAAIGAMLRLRSEGLTAHPSIAAPLSEIADQVSFGLLDGVEPALASTWQSYIATLLRQSLEFVDNPARQPGWAYEDPVILNTQGRASRIVVSRIESVAAQRPSLADGISRGGCFLDIGTGTGWIAIEAVQRWPAFTAVGIDLWDPSLALARHNVATNNVAGRVTIRKQGLESLDDLERFDLAWLPGPFLPAAVVRSAAAGLFRSLAPGGTLIFALYRQPPTAMAAALQKLEAARFGGQVWTREEAEAVLASNGFIEIDYYQLPQSPPLMAARRPAR